MDFFIVVLSLNENVANLNIAKYMYIKLNEMLTLICVLKCLWLLKF